MAACGHGAEEAIRGTARRESGATTTTGPRFPPAAQVRHGDQVFGVYAAVARTASAPQLAQATAELRRAGYRVGEGSGEINCDQGARVALGLRPEIPYSAVAIYFRTRQEAQQFVDAFQPGVVGTAAVTLYCLD